MPPRPPPNLCLRGHRPQPTSRAEKILQIASELQTMLFQKSVSPAEIQEALDIVTKLQQEAK